jgi:hypothetical protein
MGHTTSKVNYSKSSDFKKSGKISNPQAFCLLSLMVQVVLLKTNTSREFLVKCTGNSKSVTHICPTGGREYRNIL